MKIKHILALTFAAVTIGAFSSCDKIDSDDRYLAITPEQPNIQRVPRVVLLEEFTGQRCVNCPNAHGVISTLKEAYGNRFVPVGIHFQTPNDGFNLPVGPLSLVTEAGDYYASKWDVIAKGLPTGTIDMTTLSDYTEWPSMVRALMSEGSPVDIQLEASIEDNVLTATANLAAAENVSGTLLFWLCESKVIGLQTLPDGSLSIAYEHNHILRDAIGDRDGQKINIAANETDARTVSINLSGTNYVPENLSVVAFIMKDPWRNVIQAAEFDFTAHE